MAFPLLTHKCMRRGAARGFSACFAGTHYSASAPHSSTLSLLLRARERTSVQCELGTALWSRQLPKTHVWIRRLATQGARRTKKTIPSFSRLSDSRPLGSRGAPPCHNTRRATNGLITSYKRKSFPTPIHVYEPAAISCKAYVRATVKFVGYSFPHAIHTLGLIITRSLAYGKVTGHNMCSAENLLSKYLIKKIDFSTPEPWLVPLRVPFTTKLNFYLY